MHKWVENCSCIVHGPRPIYSCVARCHLSLDHLLQTSTPNKLGLNIPQSNLICLILKNSPSGMSTARRHLIDKRNQLFLASKGKCQLQAAKLLFLRPEHLTPQKGQRYYTLHLILQVFMLQFYFVTTSGKIVTGGYCAILVLPLKMETCGGNRHVAAVSVYHQLLFQLQ